MVTAVFRPYTTVSIAVEARHGLLREEGEGFLEDCFRRKRAVRNSVSVHPNWSKKNILVGLENANKRTRDGISLQCSGFDITYVHMYVCMYDASHRLFSKK